MLMRQNVNNDVILKSAYTSLACATKNDGRLDSLFSLDK